MKLSVGSHTWVLTLHLPNGELRFWPLPLLLTQIILFPATSASLCFIGAYLKCKQVIQVLMSSQSTQPGSCWELGLRSGHFSLFWKLYFCHYRCPAGLLSLTWCTNSYHCYNHTRSETNLSSLLRLRRNAEEKQAVCIINEAMHGVFEV